MTVRSRRFASETGLWRRLALVAAAGVCYMLVMFPLGCGQSLANRMMLFPTTDALPAAGAAEVFLETPGGRVQLWEAGDGPAAERLVLRLEGNGGRAEFTAAYVAQRWSDRPTLVWAMNWPGYGRSQGPARLDRLAGAALASLDDLITLSRGRPVYIDADSMGSAVALHLATQRPEAVRGLVLKNPPPLRELVMGRFGWWNLWLAAWPVSRGVPDELDAVSTAREVTAPVVIITARQDTLVPPAYQKRIVDALAGPVQIIWFEEAGHNTPIDHLTDQAIAQALRWLETATPEAVDRPPNPVNSGP